MAYRYLVWQKMPPLEKILTPDTINNRIAFARKRAWDEFNELLKKIPGLVIDTSYHESAAFTLTSEKDISLNLFEHGFHFYTLSGP